MFTVTPPKPQSWPICETSMSRDLSHSQLMIRAVIPRVSSQARTEASGPTAATQAMFTSLTPKGEAQTERNQPDDKALRARSCRGRPTTQPGHHNCPLQHSMPPTRSLSFSSSWVRGQGEDMVQLYTLLLKQLCNTIHAH